MAKILYHSDDDGRCAAAIVVRELWAQSFSRPEPNDFYEYSHGRDLVIDEDSIQDGELVFVVDLALDDVIMDAIRIFLKHNCKVTYIDHHKTSLNNLTKYQDELESVAILHKEGVSATMLAWVYTCMTLVEQSEPSGVTFDFAEKRSHVCFDENPDREYRIPMVVRFIDDWDVWRHEIDGTEEFHLAFGAVDDKHPLSYIWNEIIDGPSMMLHENYIKPGIAIKQYMEAQYQHEMKRSFVKDDVFLDEDSGDPIQCLFLNWTGNAKVFGDEINNHPMACLYFYDGRSNSWKYQLRSHNDGVDVEKIAASYGGGGHKHAAGFQLDSNIVNYTETDY